MPTALPIDEILSQISDLLEEGRNIVLVAEPGSGKTTRVPAACLGAGWLKDKKIVLLEPRRIAARAAARFISFQRGVRLGGEVGFRVRGEAQVSNETRLEIVTEGVLTRMLQADPALEDVGLVIFDEFHERSIHADLALALVLDLQRALRPDLRLMIMSATIDAKACGELIGNAALVACPGRQYPVDIRYIKPALDRRLEQTIADLIRRAHREEEGDILVFLPGRAEINRVADRLRDVPLGGGTVVLMLHSDVKGPDQDLILSAQKNDNRRVILATNVAETSLTIPRVRIVIDAGLMRVPRFDVKRGVSGLETVTISQASAAQRAGRAGRQEAGVCYRCWAEHESTLHAPYNAPEILAADLATFVLELAAWGDSDLTRYSLLNYPPNTHVEQAYQLLMLLGAIDSKRRITSHGKELLELALHPRLAHMLKKAHQSGQGELACDVIALIEEPSVLKDREADRMVSRRWLEYSTGSNTLLVGVQKRVSNEAGRLKSLLRIKPGSDKDAGLSIGALIALAYPERIARQRDGAGSTYLMRTGTGAQVPEASHFKKHTFLAIAHLDGLGANARVFLAEPIEESEIEDLFSSEIISERHVFFCPQNNSVRGFEIRALGAIEMSKCQVPIDDQEAIPLFCQAIKERGVGVLPFNSETEALRQRVQWLRMFGVQDVQLPDLSDQCLLSELENWLAPFLIGVRRMAELQKIDLQVCVESQFSRSARLVLEQLAPAKVLLPTGRAAQIAYGGEQGPSISVYLQELFGQRTTPTVCGGRVPLTVSLLSPAGRPLQVTRDLESFWRNSYQEVRKEMMGRYPKHSWPLDPLQASPMVGPRRRGG